MKLKELFRFKDLENSMALIIAISVSYLWILSADYIGYWGIGLTIITILLPTIYYVWSFKKGENLGEKFTFYFLNLIIMIAYFGLLYKAFGIKLPDGKEADLFDAFYFSVVTWTTLGYGEILPSSTESKIFVIVEVMLGYIYMGILIGKLLVLSKLGEEKKPD